MKTFLILTLAIVIAAVSAGRYRLQGHPHHHKEMQCKGEPIVVPTEEMAKFEQSRTECEKEDDGDNKHRRHLCAAVCMLKKINVLDEKGLLVESTVKTLVNSAITSTEAKKELEQGVFGCGKNVTGLGTANSDNECSNYKPLFHCFEGTFLEVCGYPPKRDEE